MDKQRIGLQWAATILGGAFPLIGLIADIAIPTWQLETIHVSLYAIGVLAFVGMAYGVKVPEITKVFFKRDNGTDNKPDAQ